MRFRFWTLLAILLLLFSGCDQKKGKSLVFFHDPDFAQMAQFAPALFSGEDKPLFRELSDVASESGYTLENVSIDILEESFINSFQQHLPQKGMPVVITSFLYSVPELQELLTGYQVAVVGAVMDIALDKLDIIGNGFELLEDEGKLLAASGQKLSFIAIKSDFQQLITQAFKAGAGDNIVVYEAELNAKTLKIGDLIALLQTDSLIVASYGPYFKSISSPTAKTGHIRIVNYPGSPDLVDPYMKKRVDAYICYDFLSSFKSAVLKLSDSRNGEKKSFYSFDLIRR